MKLFSKIGICGLIIMFFSLSQINEAQSWGFWAHKRINRLSVFTLPPEMIGFYKSHLEHITEHAVDPDKRRYAVEGEDKKHYIDVDVYGEYPFDNVPRVWSEAVEKFSEDTLMEYGILPYNLEWMMGKLTRAFEEQNLKRILRHSSDIGHYIGDGHVPLHTTVNYNGQLTGQKGIHGFWESRCPELFATDNYDFFVGKAIYVENIRDKIWEIVLESASHVPEVFAQEIRLTKEFPDDKKYAFDERGDILLKNYSYEFSEAYEKSLDGMIEDRMRDAILNIGSFWYTAWVNAGKPDLNRLGELALTDEEIEEQKELDNKSNGGKIKGRDHSK